MSMEKIVILGRGGHARSVADTIVRQGVYEIAGYVVNDEDSQEDEYPVIGCDSDLQKIFDKGIRYVVLGIGFLGKGNVREELYQRLKRIGYVLPVITDPTATVSANCEIDEGSFIGKGAIINANARVGRCCIINTGAIIEHDCIVGDFTHIAVGGVLCGNVTVGANTLVGANATVLQGRSIGDHVIVGAGECIRKNIGRECMICKPEIFGGGYDSSLENIGRCIA